VGPRWRGADAESESAPSATPARSGWRGGREEADDGWPPPSVADSGRARGRRLAGRAGQKSGWAGELSWAASEGGLIGGREWRV
jgi:hypothetical protein